MPPESDPYGRENVPILCTMCMEANAEDRFYRVPLLNFILHMQTLRLREVKCISHNDPAGQVQCQDESMVCLLKPSPPPQLFPTVPSPSEGLQSPPTATLLLRQHRQGWQFLRARALFSVFAYPTHSPSKVKFKPHIIQEAFQG